MAKNPLLSSYRAGENRVTASMVAIFERIDLGLVEAILAAASGESSLQMVSFANQPNGKGASVPDALIKGHFAYWFELKTERDALTERQLREHLANIEGVGDERLFVITPDAAQPTVIEEFGHPAITWISFATLSEAIANVVEAHPRLVSEQAKFLLGELQDLFVEDGLIDDDDTVVVAAAVAYGEYLQHHAYVCQPGRSFRQGLTHMGFYAHTAIQREIPRIEYWEDHVEFTSTEANLRRAGNETDRRLADLIEDLLTAGSREEGQILKVFLLSDPTGAATVLLDAPVANDTTSASGRPWPFTLGQRYTSIRALTAPGTKTTSDLEQ